MKYWQPFGISDPNAPYINGDPTIGRAGSIPPAGAFEQPQRELVNLIHNSNINPSDQDVTQLFKAVRSQYINYAVADPSTNENQVTVNFTPPLGTFTNGIPLRVKAAKTNTDACHLIVDGVSSPLRRADTAELIANDLRAGSIFECMWNDTFWAITNYHGTGGTGGSTSNTYITKIPYTVDTGTTNNLIAAFSPAITTLVPGDAVEVKLAHTVNGPSNIKVNALAPVAIVRGDGSPIRANDAFIGQVMLLIYTDANNFQFNGIIPPPAFSGLGVPVGGLILTLGIFAPAGTLKCNAAVLLRTDHPGLWNFANTTGRLVDEAVWQNPSNRCWTAFSRGDGSTNFRLPELRGEFLRMFDDARGVDPSRIYYQQQADGIGSVSLSGPFRLDLPVGNPSPAAGFAESGLNPQDWISFTAPPPDVGGSPIGGTMFGGYRGGGITPLDGSYIRGNGSGTLSGGANETRPRNANVLPCVVDG